MKEKDKKLEQNIRTAMEHAAPDKIEQILSACRKPGTKAVHIEEPRHRRDSRHRKIWGAAGAAAAAVLLFSLALSGIYLRGQNTEVARGMGESVILLDVNPSLSITVDTKEVVTKVEPLNEDGKTVLGEMDLSGTDLDIALNALVGSMLQNGYLNELQNSILVSVENDDMQQAAVLQDKVRTSINTVMESGSVDGAVISQTVTADKDLQQLADKYGISLGKAAVIQEAAGQDPRLAFEDLVSMSITEIALLMDSRNITPDSLVQTGTASDKAYIGKEQAAAIAHAASGADAASIVKTKVEFDSDHGVFVYEVEFNDGKMKYDYDIDAKTGEIRKQGKEALSQKGPGAGQTPSTEVPNPQEAYTLTLEAAKEAVLNAAGVNAADAVFTKEKKDRESGIYGYELKFRAGGILYEYFIDGSNGQILKAEKETGANTQDTDDPDDDIDDNDPDDINDPDDDIDDDSPNDDLDDNDPGDDIDDNDPDDDIDDDGPDDDPDDNGPDDDLDDNDPDDDIDDNDPDDDDSDDRDDD